MRHPSIDACLDLFNTIICSHGMYVPFQKELFSDSPFNPAVIVPITAANLSYPQVFSCDSVLRTMRPGEKRGSTASDNNPRVDSDGNPLARPVKEKALPKPKTCGSGDKLQEKAKKVVAKNATGTSSRKRPAAVLYDRNAVGENGGQETISQPSDQPVSAAVQRSRQTSHSSGAPPAAKPPVHASIQSSIPPTVVVTTASLSVNSHQCELSDNPYFNDVDNDSAREQENACDRAKTVTEMVARSGKAGAVVGDGRDPIHFMANHNAFKKRHRHESESEYLTDTNAVKRKRSHVRTEAPAVRAGTKQKFNRFGEDAESSADEDGDFVANNSQGGWNSNYYLFIYLFMVYNNVSGYFTDDESADERGWVTKKFKFLLGKHKISTAAYIGRTLDFTLCSDLFKPTPCIQFKDMKKFGPARIHSVVYSVKGVKSQLYFKFFSSENFRDARPPTKWCDFSYIPCECVINPKYQISLDEKWKSLGDTLFQDYMIGRQVLKKFKTGYFVGEVVGYDSQYCLYSIKFEDQELMDMNEVELNQALIGSK